MSDADKDLLSLAASISTGAHVEWEQIAQRVAGQEGAALLQELRSIEEIARFHRSGARPESDLRADVRNLQDSDPRTWGHFDILERIGAGAFGAVYRANDTKLQCEVALKLLGPPGLDSPTNPSDVLNEARLLARVRHPNVVAVYGADNIQDRVGIWMEFVKGRTLEDLLRTQGLFGAREAALIGLDLCRALAAVHRAGLLHGDVKAHNVMRAEGGRTVLMDFGAGKDLRVDWSSPAPLADDFAGTPLYLAPEVFEGGPRTKAADIYSLGVLLFHLVTEAYPVEGPTRAAVQEAHGRQERARLRDVRPDLPEEFVRIVERAAAADPQQRYESAGAFEADLARFLGSPPEPRAEQHVWRTAMATVATLSVIGAGYWVATRDSPATNARPIVSPSPSQPSSTTGEPAYKIDAALYRVKEGGEVRLQTGAPVEPGDKLSLEIRVSIPTHVYVINEDDQGESYLLFPLPGQKLTNPLPSGQPNRLPGDRDGEKLYWQVTSAGGREHFLIFASPEPVPAFERMFAALPRPELNARVLSAPLSRDAVGVVRGVGGLTSGSARQTSGSRLTDAFTTPLRETEETARGLWVRQITLDNPSRSR